MAEFAVSLDQNYESLTPLNFEIAVDADGDGKPDVLLQAADISLFIPTQPPGELFVTGFFDPVTLDGSLDWIVTKWDFNDRTVILPFTKVADGGGVPNSFKYTLTVNDNGGSDVQKGKIDFANELTLDLNNFALSPLGSAEVSATGKGPGKLLWFFRNNALSNQEVTQPITPPKK